METTGVNCFYKNKILNVPYTEKDDDLTAGDMIILQDEEGKEEIGEVIYIKKITRSKDDVAYSFSILRKTTPHDLQKLYSNRELEKEAFKVCEEKIIKHGLEMRLLKVNYSFDCNKVNFVFTAETRVDFRDLVKDLAQHFKKQIHLQQIGPRDKAREVSGFGKCGRRFCCCQFLCKLDSITMEMVRLQGMENKGSEKLSGACGKLMCCLNYETQEYRRLKETIPSIGSIIKTKEYEGEIIALDVLNQRIKLRTTEQGFQVIEVEEIKKVVKEGERQDSFGEMLEERPGEEGTDAKPAAADKPTTAESADKPAPAAKPTPKTASKPAPTKAKSATKPATKAKA